jgi:hypothetical protein
MFRITNGNSFDFIGRHNGQDFLFPQGKPVYCEDDAAAHIFGIGQPDKDSILARHGWVLPAQRKEDGMAILNAFAFEHMSPAYDAPLARIEPGTGRGPAPVGQDAPAGVEGADESASPAGGVAAQSGLRKSFGRRQPPA